MKCPLCSTEAVITGSRNVYVKSEGKLYREAVFKCRNKSCGKYQKEIGTTRKEQPLIEE